MAHDHEPEGLTTISDRAALATFFERDRSLHIYEAGDLDPFFWEDTRWYGWAAGGDLRAVALLYTGSTIPTLVLLERSCVGEAASLLRSLGRHLPASFYAHLSPGLSSELTEADLHPHGRHLKMVLDGPEKVRDVSTDDVERLGPENLQELQTLYESSYPGNWFMPRMLETGQYFGIRSGGALLSVAGVHVFSPQQRVAALGNITTMPEERGKGLARRVTARLCQSLLESVDTIGLNVHAENSAAIRCYRRLGFEVAAEYEEYRVELPAPGR